ncbi:MAG: ilvE 1 [Planctomycetota bacterium]|nr:ilvE 1 [Planctomycetota bacterium]
MIWVAGQIVPDDALKISALDRTFEHGLGLFETFRTWNGHATLLARHLARMRSSAEELRLPLEPAKLPDEDAVSALLRADNREGDAVLRITLSGGLSETEGGTVWMRSMPLPRPLRMVDSGFLAKIKGSGVLAFPSTLELDLTTPLGKHKTLNYWQRRLACDERGEEIVISPDGEIVEGMRTNVFYVVGRTLRTAGLSYPILPGIMRELILERAARLGMAVDEFPFDPMKIIRKGADPDWDESVWSRAEEVFLTNSVRGVVPVASLFARYYCECPGPWTQRIWQDTRDWLERGGIDP